MYSIIIATLLIALASIGLSFLDYTKIINDVVIEKADKAKRGVIVLLVNIGLSVILSVNYNTSIVFGALYLHTIYWTVFDASLNLFRKKSILYTSNNNRDDNDSIFDKIFNFLPNPYSGVVQIIVKMVLVLFLLTHI